MTVGCAAAAAIVGFEHAVGQQSLGLLLGFSTAMAALSYYMRREGTRAYLAPFHGLRTAVWGIGVMVAYAGLRWLVHAAFGTMLPR